MVAVETTRALEIAMAYGTLEEGELGRHGKSKGRGAHMCKGLHEAGVRANGARISSEVKGSNMPNRTLV